MREWFDRADLSSYQLDLALETVVAGHVRLSVGDDDAVGSGTTTQGATGTLREPVRID